MKNITLILLLILTANLFAQIDRSRKEFYPLNVGNVWQYRTEDNKLYNAEIRADTILDGEGYYVFGSIGGIRTTGSDKIRIDSLLRVEIYGGSASGENVLSINLANRIVRFGMHVMILMDFSVIRSSGLTELPSQIFLANHVM